jgi:hypothetical protein
VPGFECDNGLVIVAPNKTSTTVLNNSTNADQFGCNPSFNSQCPTQAETLNVCLKGAVASEWSASSGVLVNDAMQRVWPPCIQNPPGTGNTNFSKFLGVSASIQNVCGKDFFYFTLTSASDTLELNDKWMPELTIKGDWQLEEYYLAAGIQFSGMAPIGELENFLDGSFVLPSSDSLPPAYNFGNNTSVGSWAFYAPPGWSGDPYEREARKNQFTAVWLTSNNSSTVAR